jgi:hypothetical protein
VYQNWTLIAIIILKSKHPGVVGGYWGRIRIADLVSLAVLVVLEQKRTKLRPVEKDHNLGGKSHLSHVSKKGKEFLPEMLDKPFQVLSRCDHHSFDVGFLETSQTKTSQPVKFFYLSKERFHPNSSFAHRFLIFSGFGIS